MMNTNQRNKKERGGMILGVIVGALVGLGIALAVAMYMMKAPTPFNSKVTSRSSAQDAAETQKNKDWDPNAPLAPKLTVKPEDAGAAAGAGAPVVAANPATPPAASTTAKTPAIAVTTQTPSTTATAAPAAASPAPTAPTAAATITAETEYYVQVGAFRGEDEANAMRGKLALAGFEGRIVERDQSGRTIYRVRVGPYSQAASEKTKTNLEAAGFETVIVRNQK